MTGPGSRRSALVSWLGRQRPSVVLGVSALAIVVLGLADYLTGYEIAFSIFYVVPVAAVAYVGGRRRALIASLLAAAIWLLADFTAGHRYSMAVVGFWNAFTRFLFFGLVSVALAALRDALRQEQELSRVDFLTGAANRRAFYETISVELDRSRRYGRPFSVAHLDVDDFKIVNDTLGHQTGDAVLRVVAETMQRTLRKTDVVARLGGDEFALLLPETAREDARAAIEKAKRALDEEVARRQWPVSFSIGLLTCLDAPRSVEDVLKLVDGLTYQAKRGGKNTLRHDVVAARLVSVAAERD